jgi:uncharacterized protein (DUF305 family)
MSHMSGTSSASNASTAAGHNATDVMFASMMIPHHAQAIEMAKLAATRASSPEVKSLAAAIEAAQQPEIDLMSGWLRSWGQPVPTSSAMSGTSQMGHANGMMAEAEMRALDSASGARFDRLFLTQMVQHHEGAIEMAKTEQASGENPDAIALSGRIIKDQTAEITKIQAMLKG